MDFHIRMNTTSLTVTNEPVIYFQRNMEKLETRKSRVTVENSFISQVPLLWIPMFRNDLCAMY